MRKIEKFNLNITFSINKYKYNCYICQIIVGKISITDWKVEKLQVGF